MPILPGRRLGPYEILAAVGAGGMGEVYRARDTRLDRIVAVKVLPQHFANRSDLRERFEREARTIASLNHPHICVLYDIGQQDGTDYLVMEYLDGETLTQRLCKGPLALEQVLQYAIEIADALDKAHRKGVTHRDLKPGNIMLTKSGAKLLDFGLAKLRQEAAPANISLSKVPTEGEAVTAQGTILGTLQYMAPEQLEGKEADARTDIFAFGTVVYEMATGKKAFEGKSQASLIAKILETEPPAISSLQPMTPPALDRVVKKCLAKDPDKRWQDAGDLCDELKWITDGASHGASPLAATEDRGQLRRRWAVFSGLACLIVAVVTGLATWNLRPTASRSSHSVTRLAVAVPPEEQLDFALAGSAIALSPDGTELVYGATRSGTQQLYVRSLDNLEGQVVAGTDGASSPFFSSDGQWVGFFADAKLKKVPVTGGPPLTLCDAPEGAFGASWAPNDIIYFTPGSFSGIWQVSAKGGTPQPLTTLDPHKGEISHRWPQVLPGGKALLFTAWTGPGWDEQQVQLQMLASGERHVLIQGGHLGRYVPTGQIIYQREGSLLAVPFDFARFEVTASTPVPVIENVWDLTDDSAPYAISDSGSIAYVPGNAHQFEASLVWVDRSGKVEPLSAPLRSYQSLRLSPDGQQVAVSIEAARYDIWVYSLTRGTFTRLTSDAGSSQFPIWTPDGKRLTYRATRKGTRNVFWRMADGTGTEERLTTGEGNQAPSSWSPDGQVLGFTDANPTAGSRASLWRLADHQQQPLHKTSFHELGARFSPDGHWLAYSSDETGRPEIYVEPYPGPAGKSQVSTDGGRFPVWSRNGRELFYRNGDKMMVVDVTVQPTFSAAKPRMLFREQHWGGTALGGSYDVSPDGQRFLMIKESEEATTLAQIVLVQNWFEELKQRVPTGKK